jgi:serine/threonine protein kinase
MTPPVDADHLVGSEIAGYRLEALLGRDRNAIVYLAEDTRLNRQVALKLLSPELAADEQFREQFLRETRLATLLDHPGIIPVYEAGEVEGRLYVVMGYVKGADLASLLAREGRLEPERALALVGESPRPKAIQASATRGVPSTCRPRAAPLLESR